MANHIKNIKDVNDWVYSLFYDKHINFDPKKSFADYVNDHNARVFSSDEVAELNVNLVSAMNVCNENNEDIYAIANKISYEHSVSLQSEYVNGDIYENYFLPTFKQYLIINESKKNKYSFDKEGVLQNLRKMKKEIDPTKSTLCKNCNAVTMNNKKTVAGGLYGLVYPFPSINYHCNTCDHCQNGVGMDLCSCGSGEAATTSGVCCDCDGDGD